MKAVTHSGGFHADDAVAWALIRTFVEADYTLTRTRDAALVSAADLVFDVGGIYDPATLRFDHHQPEYTGPLSSAGMVLRWLVDSDRIPADLGAVLREEIVDYIDAVDNGRRAPAKDVPCLANIVEALNAGCDGASALDAAFDRASGVAQAMVEATRRGWVERRETRALVVAGMADADARESNVVILDRHVRWKAVYFEEGGAEHRSEFIVFPGAERDWRVVAVPPRAESFAQKRPLPTSWAGLRDDALSGATGIPGSVFCHKNRFIAVFTDRDGALDALSGAGLIQGRLPGHA